MNFGQWSYLFMTFIFGGTAISIQFILNWDRIMRHRLILFIVIVLGVVGTAVSEPVGLRWNAWVYSKYNTLNLTIFGAPIESYVFALFVGLAIASATLVWSDYEESGLPVLRTTMLKWKKRFKAVLESTHYRTS